MVQIKQRLFCGTFSQRFSCMSFCYSPQIPLQSPNIVLTTMYLDIHLRLSHLNQMLKCPLWRSLEFVYLYYQNMYIEVTGEMLTKLMSNKDSHSFTSNMEFYKEVCSFLWNYCRKQIAKNDSQQSGGRGKQAPHLKYYFSFMNIWALSVL